MSRLAQKFGLKEDRRVFTSDNRLVLSDCKLGLEFEWEATGTVARNRMLPETDWSHYWSWHEEGSLRNQGSELVFTEPLFGKDALKAIEGLCALAQTARWQSTLRTGIHVHIDVRDLEVPQLVGLCTLYALFEKPIYRWIGDDRENNHFCLPWYKAEGSVLQAARILQSASRDQSPAASNELIQEASNYQRYAGFNLASLSKFGSLEARQLKTTHNVQRIVDWINILLSLKRAAFRVPQSDGAIIQMVENHGARQVGMDLFGDVFNLLDYPDLEADVKDTGVGVAEELLREGLTVNLWDVFALPRGKNKGFEKFLENNRPLAQAVQRPRMHDAAAIGGIGELELQAQREAIRGIFNPRMVVRAAGREFRVPQAAPMDALGALVQMDQPFAPQELPVQEQPVWRDELLDDNPDERRW